MLPDCLLPDGAGRAVAGDVLRGRANLTGDMLVKVDRMSMANSLEVRCPLLDQELAELAASFPHAWNMAERQGRDLIRAMAERFPGTAGAPQERFRRAGGESGYRGPLREMLRTLAGPRFLERGIVRPAFIRYMLEEPIRRAKG